MMLTVIMTFYVIGSLTALVLLVAMFLAWKERAQESEKARLIMAYQMDVIEEDIGAVRLHRDKMAGVDRFNRSKS